MDYEKAIKERLDAIENFLKFEPVEKEADLVEIMTLGEYWDDPEVVIKSLDQHPQFEARYLGLRRTVEIAKNKVKQKMDFFEATTKEYLSEEIFKANIKAGMTPSNAKPTGPTINNKYLIEVVEGEGGTAEAYKELAEEFELAEDAFFKVKIITDALRARREMLISMASLLGRLVDNHLIILKKGHKKNSQADVDGFK